MTTLASTPPATSPDTCAAPSRSIFDVFGQVADRRGDALAVSCPGQQLTYTQLAEQARALARRLLARIPDDAAADAPIALLASASPASVVATLAVLATGHPFVVLDTQLPVGRLRQVQRVARAVLCVASADLAERAREVGGLPVLVLQEELAACEAMAADDVELPAVDPAAPASIVFTSGSTGIPKGVVHSHRLQVALAEATAREYGGDPTEYRVGSLTPAAFVAGMSTLLVILLCGGSLHLYDPREQGLRGLPDWLRAEGVTAVTLTPSLLRSLATVPELAPGLPSLRLVSLAGEAVLGTDVRAVWEHLGAHVVASVGYGSSETMAISGALYLPGTDVPPGRLPAGRPYASKDVEIVDDEGNPVLPGAVGMPRITAAPHLMADGYLGAPPDVAALFTRTSDGRRSFLLRDLVRRDDDGVLHVVGRADDAVKVRGYLVEPSEIEDALRSVDGVAEAVVIAVPAGATSALVGYVGLTGQGRPPSAAALRRALRATLPDWMVPAEVVVLSALPRTERGKVDREALPRPVRPSFVAPQGPAEAIVAQLWSQILGRDDIGRRDSFLALGGDSLAVEEFLTRLRDQHHVTLTTSDVVENPTVEELAQVLATGGARAAAPRSLVPLRTTGRRTPLFCFSGAGGSGQGFWPLADALGADQPVYALQPHGMEGAAVPSFSIAMAARRYLRTIRTIQPHGPYFLAGHSMGGLIALEVARRLDAAGEVVWPVVLLDTNVPPRATGAGITDLLALVAGGGPLAAQALSAATGWTPPAPSADASPAHRGQVAPAARAQKQPRRKSPLGVVRGVVKESRALFLAATNQVPVGAQEGTFFWFQARMSMLHRPRPWTGAAVLLRTAENTEPASAWASVLTGPVTVLDVPGGHTSMLRPPYVDAVAAHVAATAGPPIGS